MQSINKKFQNKINYRFKMLSMVLLLLENNNFCLYVLNNFKSMFRIFLIIILSQLIISLFRIPGTYQISKCTSTEFGAAAGDWEGGQNKKRRNEEDTC